MLYSAELQGLEECREKHDGLPLDIVIRGMIKGTKLCMISPVPSLYLWWILVRSKQTSYVTRCNISNVVNNLWYLLA